jgi:hypothetical protein
LEKKSLNIIIFSIIIKLVGWMSLQYYCEICNSYIFGGNGLREHRRSQKHREALKSNDAPTAKKQ